MPKMWVTNKLGPSVALHWQMAEHFPWKVACAFAQSRLFRNLEVVRCQGAFD